MYLAFLDPKTKDKLFFCTSDEDLLKYIDRDQLEERYGGTIPYNVPIILILKFIVLFSYILSLSPICSMTMNRMLSVC